MTKGITFLTAALGCAILSAAVQAESNVKYTQTISQATNPLATNGMVTSPNYLATQAGVEVLRKGGSAVDAMTYSPRINAGVSRINKSSLLL